MGKILCGVVLVLSPAAMIAQPGDVSRKHTRGPILAAAASDHVLGFINALGRGFFPASCHTLESLALGLGQGELCL